MGVILPGQESGREPSPANDPFLQRFGEKAMPDFELPAGGRNEAAHEVRWMNCLEVGPVSLRKPNNDAACPLIGGERD